MITACLLPCASALAQEKNIDELLTLPEDELISSTTQDNGTVIEIWKDWEFVKLHHLERIEGTPFATKVVTIVPHCFTSEKKIVGNASITRYQATIDVVQFCEDMKLSSFGVLQSYAKDIRYIGDSSDGYLHYEVSYFETYYLNSKTADGCFQNFYIGCNQSFTEFFDEQKNLSFTNYDKDGKVTTETTALLTEQDIEVFSNSLYSAYPEQLGKYKLDEIYGYWGFVPVPKSDTLNGFFNEIGGGTFKSASLNSFSVQHAIPYKFMEAMQDDYNMSLFYKLLNGYGHLFGANKDWVVWCYMFYVDGGDAELLITQNGSNKLESTQGSIVNEADKLIDNIDWSAFSPATVLGMLLVLAFVAFIFLLVLKFGGKNKQNKKR